MRMMVMRIDLRNRETFEKVLLVVSLASEFQMEP